MAVGVIAAVVVFIGWVVVHLLLMHVRPTPRRFQAMSVAALLSFPATPALTWLIWQNADWRAALAGAEHAASAYGMASLLHLLFYFCFVECFYHVERAVTLRMVIELFEEPGHAMQLDALLAHYPVDDMVQRRLEGLQQSGFVHCGGDGRWHLTPKGRFFARAMRVSSAVFNSKPQNERLP
ncbi:MAG: hypothetical protein NZ740_06235 [Kiritimatiellae bacterium]|nr:hypothetical protein [Kiritimatiellia bacterium]MDW8458693.1 hypothetical protein [Verrucomicrobiota bacterium]